MWNLRDTIRNRILKVELRDEYLKIAHQLYHSTEPPRCILICLNLNSSEKILRWPYEFHFQLKSPSISIHATSKPGTLRWGAAESPVDVACTSSNFAGKCIISPKRKLLNSINKVFCMKAYYETIIFQSRTCRILFHFKSLLNELPISDWFAILKSNRSFHNEFILFLGKFYVLN